MKTVVVICVVKVNDVNAMQINEQKRMKMFMGDQFKFVLAMVSSNIKNYCSSNYLILSFLICFLLRSGTYTIQFSSDADVDDCISIIPLLNNFSKMAK